MLLSQVIKNAQELIESMGDVEVFSTTYTPEDVQLSTNTELTQAQKEHVIEILNDTNSAENSIKDLIEDAISRIT